MLCPGRFILVESVCPSLRNSRFRNSALLAKNQKIQPKQRHGSVPEMERQTFQTGNSFGAFSNFSSSNTKTATKFCQKKPQYYFCYEMSLGGEGLKTFFSSLERYSFIQLFLKLFRYRTFKNCNFLTVFCNVLRKFVSLHSGRAH